MIAMALRTGALLALFSANLTFLSCSGGNNAPQPGTPAFYWGAAKQTYVTGDYQKTLENLGNILSTQNEYVARAQPWMLVMTSGMAQGYMDLAEAYDAGSHANRGQAANFHRQVNTYRGNANTLALQFAETFGKFDNKDESIPLAFAYPTGSATEDLLIGKIMGGAWPRESDGEAIQKRAIERGVLLAACRAAGAKNDPAKALEILKTGDAKVARPAFLNAMAMTLFEESQLYARKRMDQPDRMKVFCARAQDALKQVPVSKESQDLDKRIQVALKAKATS